MKFRGNKKPYIIRITCTILLFTLELLAFLPAGKPLAGLIQFNIAPAAARVITDFSITAIIIVGINLLAAFFFGRFYCSVFCPFGILQDIVGTFFRRKTGKTVNLPYIRYTVLAITFSFMLLGVTAVLRFLDPYSNFGNIVTGFVNIKTSSFAVFIPLAIIIVLVIWKNRIFCTTICPVGTLLGLCSKFSPKKLAISKDICKGCGVCERECPTGAINSKEKELDNERCIRCMRCIAVCPGDGISFVTKEKEKFIPSRRTFITAGLVTAAAVTVFAKGKELALAIAEGLKKRPICPPGAGSVEDFVQKCTNCGLCVEHCKGKILKKPNEEYSTVHIDFSNGKCEFDCKNCSEVCPTGAIRKISLAEKQNCRIGLAKFNYEKCTKCGLCSAKCPKGAIVYQPGKQPVYLASKCIGCGACESICPSGAIEIVAINTQSQI